MTLIDNKNQTLQSALKNALPTSGSLDILVGYFYFSGFQALADQLRDKKIRILVGLEIEPSLIPEISQISREEDVDLAAFQPHRSTTSPTILKENYIDALVGFINDSDIFDSEESMNAYNLFREKILDGTLEIRKTIEKQHAKLYLVHNKAEVSQNGDFPGTVFTGSSNLTYRGLVGQGELDDSFREKVKFAEYQKHFDDLWNDSRTISIADSDAKDKFLNTLDSRIWMSAVPEPYEIYIRILHELFSHEDTESLLTPSKITHDLYIDLEYQLDAIRSVIDKLHKYDGAFLADVVGLGKSIIAIAIARNLEMNTVIIAPPHLIPQWEDYKEQFGVRGSKVFSSGAIKTVYERYKESSEPILFILDEAHRYRNEDTDDYKLLHQVCRGNRENKVLLLTATPFNNGPKDVFALLKLFQIPGESTIRSVDNLNLRYRQLIQRYRKLRSLMASKSIQKEEIDIEAAEIAKEQRSLVESVVIRRSRLDLKNITRYREDLKRQGVEFAEVKGPELIEYDLGLLSDLYIETLELITQSKDKGFTGARYKPSEYIKDEKRQEFLDKVKKELGEETDLKTAQTNLAQFMRRLLVMRFESSKDAFRTTLDKMISSNELVEKWLKVRKKVPIMKKGQIPDLEEYDSEDGESMNALDEEIQILKSDSGMFEIDEEFLAPTFFEHLKHDSGLLKQIRDRWYGNEKISNLDPKLDEIQNKLVEFLKENPIRKIVIFSSYADTVNYLYKMLQDSGMKRLFKYTAADPGSVREEIIANFDASISEVKQKNDFDVLIATDAISEGFNLHRAGIIINYDIPYNPTRVIQRVGRINRINKKVFDFIYIYNCFPTVIGEEEIRVRAISTLKIKLINEIVGSDTKTLTSDETPKSFFKDEFQEQLKSDDVQSWETPHREVYYQAIKSADVLEKISMIPRRSRIKRIKTGNVGAVVYGKKGQHSVFTYGVGSSDMAIVSAEEALNCFVAAPSDKSTAVDVNFNQVFNIAKDKLFAKDKLARVAGRRSDAVNILEYIGKNLPSEKDYCNDVINLIKQYDDLPDGTVKDIAKLNIKNVQEAFERLSSLVPVSRIRNTQDRVDRNKEEQELLLFAEQLE